MRLLLPAVMALCSASPVLAAPSPEPARTSGIEGEWRGDVSPAPGSSIPLVLKVAGGPGTWTATLDSPAQGAFGLPIESIRRDGQDYRFNLTTPPAMFAATLSADGQKLVGSWMQNGGKLPLTLLRAPQP